MSNAQTQAVEALIAPSLTDLDDIGHVLTMGADRRAGYGGTQWTKPRGDSARGSEPISRSSSAYSA